MQQIVAIRFQAERRIAQIAPAESPEVVADKRKSVVQERDEQVEASMGRPIPMHKDKLLRIRLRLARFKLVKNCTASSM
jgi:hypothetical protein